MLVEFLNRVVALADERRTPHVVKVPHEPDHVYHVSTPAGQLQRHRAAPLPRAHLAGDLATLVEFAIHRAVPQDCCFWYSRTEVVLVLDNQDRRDMVRLPLQKSEPIGKLQFLAAQRPYWMSQREFVNLLRIDLAGCLGAAGNLLPVVRQLKFRQLAQSQQEVQHGKSSLGKAIEAELHGAGNLPEQVVLEVPLFATLSLRSQPVLCATDIDPATEKLALIPLPGALEQAYRNGEADLCAALSELLSDNDIPVYYGRLA